MTRNRLGSLLGAALLLATLVGSARADEISNMLNKVPPNANAVVVVNIASMLRSPIAQQQNWSSALELDYIGGALPFPPGTPTAVMAFQLDMSTQSSPWQVSLFRAPKPLAFDYIAQTERGTTGTIGGGLPMVKVPRTNSYIVNLGDNLYASATPALTTEVTKWLRAAKERTKPAVHDFVQKCLARTTGEDLVFVLDMEDMVDERVLANNLRNAKSLKGKNVDVADLAKLIAGIKGVRFSVKVGGDFEGKLMVEFTGVTSRFADVLPAVTQEALEHLGVAFEDVGSWTPNLTTNSLTLSGKMSELTFRRLLAMVAPPTVPVMGDAMESPGDENAGTVRASRRYLAALDKLLSDLRNQIPKCRDYNEAAVISENFAKRISRLPQVRVDEDLLGLAGRTEAQLRAVANSYRGARLDYKALDAERTESLQVSAGGAYAAGYAGWWGGYAGAYYNPGSFLYSNNFQEVNVAQAKLVSSTTKERDEMLTKMYEDVTNMRQKLAAKYKTSF